MRTPWRRLGAWLIDWMCILGWVAVTAAVGIPLYLGGVIAPAGPAALNIIGALVVVVPVVVAATLLESGRHAATPGKRALGLRVRSGEAAPSIMRAAVRNTLKIGLPWVIGHAAVIAIVTTSASGVVATWVWVLTAIAYATPLVWVVSLFLPSGRTPYDVVARTVVVRTPAAPGSG